MRSTSTEAALHPGLAAPRSFGPVWLGHTLGLMGAGIYQVALMWWVLQATGSTTAMATVTVFTLLPTLVIGPLAGVYIDRLDRRSLIIAAKLGQAGLVLVPGLLLAGGRLEVWHTYLVAAGLSVAMAFMLPATTASLPNLVPAAGLVRANSLMQLAMGLSGVAGPALGGVIVAARGEAGAMCLAGGVFVLAGSCTALARWPSPRSGGGAGSSVTRELLEGLFFIRRQAMLFSTALLTCVLNFLATPLSLLLPVMARDFLGGGPAAYGTLGASISLGMAGGAGFMGFRGDVRGKGRLILLTVGASGLAMAFFGLSPALPPAVASLVALGGFIGVANVLFATALQMLIPDDCRGRVMSALSTFNQGLRPLAVILVGVLADRHPAPLLVVAAGVLLAGVTAASFLFPGLRDIP